MYSNLDLHTLLFFAALSWDMVWWSEMMLSPSWSKMKCVMQHLGTKWFCIFNLDCERWSGSPPLDWLPAKAVGARSAHRWFRMSRSLTSFSQPAEAVCRGVATVIPNSQKWELSAGWGPVLPPTLWMLLWGLQRYYLSPHTPHTPRDAAVGFTEGTTSPHTPQGMLLWGLQRYYLSPHTPRDGAVGFTEVLPLPTHPKGWCCGVYKGTTSPHTPQGMLLWGLQRYYLSPHTPRDGAVGFTKVLPLPTHPKGCCCGVYKGTTSPHTPQGMVLWGLQRYYLSPHTPHNPHGSVNAVLFWVSKFQLGIAAS